MEKFANMTIDQLAAHIRGLRIQYAGAKADGHIGTMRGLEESHLEAMTEYRQRILAGQRAAQAEDDIL